MEFDTNQEVYGSATVICDKTSEENVKAEIGIPEYLPSIVRVVKAELCAGISSVTSSGERVSIDGTTVIRVLYCCEEGRLHCVWQAVDYTTQIEMPDATVADTVNARAVTDYVNCRASSPRALEVSGKFSVQARVLRKNMTEYLCGIQGDGLQLSTEQLTVSSLSGITVKQISMSDVFEIPDSSEDIEAIISVRAYATASDVKQISGKLMLRGEFELALAYIASGEAQRVEHIKHSLPINQIIEAEGVSELSECDISLDVSQINVVPKAKTDNTMRLFDLNTVISVSAAAYDLQAVTVISDAYSVTCGTELTREVLDTSTRIASVNELHVVRESVDISANKIVDVLDVICTEEQFNSVFDAGRLRTDGVIRASIIARDTESHIVWFEKEIEYYYDYPLDAVGGSPEFIGSVTVTASDCILTSTDRLELRAELRICGAVFVRHNTEAVSKIIATQQRAIGSTAAAVTVYFPSENEKLWDIAKKYSTTVEAISLENELVSDTVSGEMLFIPGM